jgi:hypothetical protein
MSMFKPLHSEFNLKRLVIFIAALWLQVTVLVIVCCISSPRMSRPSNDIDAPRVLAVNGAESVDVGKLWLATGMAA